MDYTKIIKEIGRGATGSRPLDAEVANELFAAMINGAVPELELGAIVMALRIKSESLAELTGFHRAAQQHLPRLALPHGGPKVVVLPSYNGARRQPNLMPWLALALQAAGVPVLIHGRADFPQRASTFELLGALGIAPSTDMTAANACIAEGKIALLRCADWLPGLDRLLALRLRMGVRGTAHTLVKLLDPAPGHSVRVVAVTHPEYLARMDGFLTAQYADALLMRGTEGEAYANPRRRPLITGYRHGAPFLVCDAEPGSMPPQPDQPMGVDVDANAILIRQMLAGDVAIPDALVRQFEALRDLATGDIRPRPSCTAVSE